MKSLILYLVLVFGLLGFMSACELGDDGTNSGHNTNKIDCEELGITGENERDFNCDFKIKMPSYCLEEVSEGKIKISCMPPPQCDLCETENGEMQ